MDEAWETGELLAEGVVELLKAKRPFTAEKLQEAYVARRRSSWVEREAKIAEKSRDGFQFGFLTGLIGMGISGLTGGFINISPKAKPPFGRIPTLEEYYSGLVTAEEIAVLSAMPPRAERRCMMP